MTPSKGKSNRVRRAHDSDFASRYQFMIENMANAVAVYEAVEGGEDFVFKEFNHAAEQIDGIKREEVLGKSVLKMFPGVKDFGLFDVFQRVWRTGKPEHHPTSLYKDERLAGWRENYVYKLPSGEVVAIYEDVTERKRLEDVNSRLAAIVEFSNDGIVSRTLDGTITSCNKAYESIYGYTREELIGKSIEFSIPPGYADEAKRVRERVTRGELIQPYETKRVRKDGKIIDISLTVSPIKDAAGRVVGISGIARDITERKKAEETTSRLAAIVESSNDAIIGRTPDMVITSWNKAAEKIFGYTAEEMIGKTLFIPAPAGYADSKQTREKAQRGEQVEPYETKRIRKDGKIIDVSLTFSPIKSPTGEIIGTSQTAREITQHKRMEEELKRYSQHLEHLVHERTMKLSKSEEAAHRLAEELTALDATVLGITETADLASLLRTIVERAVELLRTDAGALYLCNLEQQKVRGIISYKMPIDAAGIVLKYGEGSAGTVAKTGQPLIIDDCRTWPGRATAYEHVKQFRALLSVPLIWHGKVTGAINMVSYNESRRFTQDDLTLLTRFAKHAAIVVERRKMEDRLRESEEKFRRIAEGSFDPILTFNQQLQVTYASPALFLITGYAPEQVIGKHFTNFLPEEGRAKRIQAFSRALAGEVVRARETELLMADGSLAHVEITLSPITESGGTVIGVESILRDTTERHKLAELKDQFMSSVTHELRTPLVSINGYLDLILSDGQVSGEVESYLQVVKRNSDRLLALTNDLLDVQRMQAGKLQLNMKPLNLRDVIDQVASEIRPLIDEKKQTLSLEMPKGPLPVQGDPIRLSQVFMNVLSNANKFAPEGGQLILSAKDTEGVVVVQVSENGIGINCEDLERIFQPFASIQKPTYIKGTGLGLSISKGLVEAHGGKIWAESKGEGKGATFTFTIPKQNA